MFILQNEGKLFPVDYPKVMHKILGKYALLLVIGELHKKLRSTVISFVSASKSDESNFLHFVEMLALSRINSWGSNCKQVAFYKEAKRVCMLLSTTIPLFLNIKLLLFFVNKFIYKYKASFAKILFINISSDCFVFN